MDEAVLATPSLLDAALTYAGQGLYVFPCAPGRKWPITQHGFLDASIDPVVISAWWAENPDANIGLDCGRSRIAVLDVDTKPRRDGSVRDGRQSLADLLKRLGVTGEIAVPVQKTPSGGFHLFFRAPSTFELPSGADIYGEGLDVRAVGGYVVLAPSVLPNGSYAWSDPRDAAITTGIVDWMLGEPPQRKRVVEDEQLTTIIEGGRNFTLTRMAGTMRRYGWSTDEIEAALLVANRVRCLPPLEVVEVARIAHNVGRYEPTFQVVAPPITPEIHTLEALYAEPESHIEWLIDGMLPAGGIMAATGKPKSGKTTGVANIVRAVAEGTPFFGRECAQGVVLWVALEESRQQIKERFMALNIAEDARERVLFYIGRLKTNAEAWLIDKIETYKPSLIVLDTFYRFARPEDMNDYGQVTKSTDALVEIARTRNVSQVWIHHNNKGDARFENASGSNALIGAVDTTLLFDRHDERADFYVRTQQRTHKPGEGDLGKSLVKMHANGRLMLLGTTRDVGIATLQERVLRALDMPRSKNEVIEGAKGNKATLRATFEQLVTDGLIAKVSGTGSPRDPFIYTRNPARLAEIEEMLGLDSEAT